MLPRSENTMMDLAGTSPQDEVFRMQERSARNRLLQEENLFLLNPKSNRAFLTGEKSRIGNGRVMIALGLLLLVIGLGFAGYFGYRYFYENDLHNRGTIVTARVVDLDVSVNSRRNSRTYYVEYEYFANDTRYERRQQIQSALYSRLNFGDNVDVVYDKTTPWESFLTGRWRDSSEQTGAIGFSVLMGGFCTIAGIICLNIERLNRNYSYKGRVLPGRVLEATGKRGSKNAYNVTIRYEYYTPEGIREEKKSTNVRGDLRNGPLPPPGTPLAVLYLSPKRVRLM